MVEMEFFSKKVNLWLLLNFPTSGFSIISLHFFVTMKLRPEYTCYTQYAWVCNSKSSVSLFTYVSWFLFYGFYSWLPRFVSVDVWTFILTARIYSFTFTENYTHLLFSLFVEDLQKIEWNDDGDGGGGGGWRNGAMGRQHITLAAHRSRISLLPCTFAAPRVALCATVRSFTDLANYEALTQFSWWLSYNSSSSTIELSSLVGSWLFCIQVLACSVSFSACLELVWRFEWRTFYIASLRVKLILACSEEVLK